MGHLEHCLQQPLKLVQSASGQATAAFTRGDGRELYLHSRYNPAEEAKYLISPMPIKEQTLYIILGCGLGYHVRELLKRITCDSKIIVIEPYSELFGPFMTHLHRKNKEGWIDDKRLAFYAFKSPDGIPLTLASYFFSNRLVTLHLFTHIPSANTNPSFYKQAAALIQCSFMDKLQSHVSTINLTLESNLTNYWYNLPVTWQAPSIRGFKGVWQNQPVVIVSAGPSLGTQIESLKKFKGKALILCVAAAAKVLMKHNIMPDFVIAVDPFEPTQQYFEGWDSSAIPLLYYHQMYWGALEKHAGPQYWFTMNGEPMLPLVKESHGGNFIHGGTVAFSALQFAHYINANPIIFVGQDFAFLDGHTHAAGADYDADAQKLRNTFLVKANDGNMVVTNSAYHSYLLYIQEYIRQYNNYRYINTSVKGAYLEGMEVMPLDSVLKLCRENILLPAQIRQEVPQHSADVRMFRELLTKWRNELIQYFKETDQHQSLEKTVKRFKKMELYKRNTRAYDDYFHAIQLLNQWNHHKNSEIVTSRINGHCWIVYNKVKTVLEGWGQ